MAFEIPLSSFPSPLPENELKRELNGFIDEKKKINLSLSFYKLSCSGKDKRGSRSQDDFLSAHIHVHKHWTKGTGNTLIIWVSCNCQAGSFGSVVESIPVFCHKAKFYHKMQAYVKGTRYHVGDKPFCVWFLENRQGTNLLVPSFTALLVKISFSLLKHVMILPSLQPCFSSCFLANPRPSAMFGCARETSPSFSLGVWSTWPQPPEERAKPNFTQGFLVFFSEIQKFVITQNVSLSDTKECKIQNRNRILIRWISANQPFRNRALGPVPRRARVLASKLLHFVWLTDSFIVLDAKLLKPRSLM